MAAVLAAEPAVASHFSAAWLWGLIKARPETIHLTTPARRRRRSGFVLHFAPLDPADRSEREDIPLPPWPVPTLTLPWRPPPTA